MKFSVLSATGILAAAVSAKPCLDRCRSVIVSDTPASLGQAFCSSFLSLEPVVPVTAKVTVVLDDIVTTTSTKSETTTTTAVTTDNTVTTTTGTVTQFARRDPTPDPVSASILSACHTNSVRISRVCSSLLPAASSPGTSTLTIKETTTYTTVVQYTTTAVETTSNTATATSYAVATILSQPIMNGGFDGGNMLPWAEARPAGETMGEINFVKSGNVCVQSGAAVTCHTSDIIRMLPPANGYIAIAQTFTARPSTTYRLRILLNSRYAGLAGNAAMEAWYNGVKLGTHECNTPDTVLYFETISAWEFTTDATGTGKIELRNLNRASTAGGYTYIDDIMVVRV